MKNTLLALSILLFSVSACKKDDSPTSAKNEVNKTVSSGTWVITYFLGNGVDKTSKFSGYTFTFASGGALTSTKGSNTLTGSWNITNRNSNDDSLEDLEFNISFPSPSGLEELNQDWDILSNTRTRFEIQHISSGLNGINLVIFEKI